MGLGLSLSHQSHKGIVVSVVPSQLVGIVTAIGKDCIFSCSDLHCQFRGNLVSGVVLLHDVTSLLTLSSFGYEGVSHTDSRVSSDHCVSDHCCGFGYGVEYSTQSEASGSHDRYSIVVDVMGMSAMTGVPEQGVAPKPRPVSVPGGCLVYVPCSRSVIVPCDIHIMRLYKLPKYMLREVSIYSISCRKLPLTRLSESGFGYNIKLAPLTTDNVLTFEHQASAFDG